MSYAHKKGLSAISLTDHDTIDGLKEAKKQAELLDIRFINGVEINSFCCVNGRKINIHVLGYLFNISEIKVNMAKGLMLKLLLHSISVENYQNVLRMVQ